MTVAAAGFAAGAWAFRAPIRAAARPLLAATLAAACAGAESERVAIAARALPPAASRLRAHAVGRPALVSPLTAAFLTALAADDDALWTPVVAAALAAGQAIDAGGAGVLDAAIAGMEIAVRLAAALGPSHLARGWDPRGTCARVGAAVAAARVLGLQREPAREAIGIAATSAGGVRVSAGTMTAAFIGAAAAADGVEAALLARAEFTGAVAALEGRRGLGALMSGAFEAAALSDGLGERFAFLALELPPSAPPAGERAQRVHQLAARIERLPSIGELVAATLP